MWKQHIPALVKVTFPFKNNDNYVTVSDIFTPPNTATCGSIPPPHLQSLSTHHVYITKLKAHKRNNSDSPRLDQGDQGQRNSIIERIYCLNNLTAVEPCNSLR